MTPTPSCIATTPIYPTGSNDTVLYTRRAVDHSIPLTLRAAIQTMRELSKSSPYMSGTYLWIIYSPSCKRIFCCIRTPEPLSIAAAAAAVPSTSRLHPLPRSKSLCPAAGIHCFVRSYGRRVSDDSQAVEWCCDLIDA
jgi:hypothetical protein